MDTFRTVLYVRALRGVPSRRDLVRGLGGAGLGLACAQLLHLAAAKKKRKHRKRKRKRVNPNEFGCLEVGDPCQNADQCCSGICEGKKCRAHDVGTCDQDQPGYCEVGNPELAVCLGGGINGICVRTTAGSNVCINSFVCADCQRDADCVALGFPPGSSCVPVRGDLACADHCKKPGDPHMACVHLAPED